MAFDIFKFLFGGGPEMQQATTMTQGQQGLQNQILNGIGAPTGAGFDYLMQILGGGDEAFADFEAPFKQQFERETIPGIAERFAGLGSGGSLGSSGLNQSLGQAGKDLSMQLAALRSGLKSQAINSLQNYANIGSQKSFENLYDPGSYGVLGGFAQGAGEGAGAAATKYFLG